jgi:hypothetical protein
VLRTMLKYAAPMASLKLRFIICKILRWAFLN